jgi:hypothetical protein
MVLEIFPQPIARLFDPWLQQIGFTKSNPLPDHE